MFPQNSTQKKSSDQVKTLAVAHMCPLSLSPYWNSGKGGQRYRRQMPKLASPSYQYYCYPTLTDTLYCKLGVDRNLSNRTYYSVQPNRIGSSRVWSRILKYKPKRNQVRVPHVKFEIPSQPNSKSLRNDFFLP